MTPDEGRALFDAALDGELDADTQRAFDALLTRDEEVRLEYARHRDVLAAARSLAREAPQVDLLKGVQDKLRARSGGRFYRDRFSAQSGRSSLMLWILALSAAALIAAAAGLVAYTL